MLILGEGSGPNLFLSSVAPQLFMGLSQIQYFNLNAAGFELRIHTAKLTK